MTIRFFVLTLLLAGSAAVYGQSDSAAATGDSLPRVRRSMLSLAIGGQMSAALQYDCRFSPKNIRWFSADINLGFGGSDYGTGFYLGGTALFFPIRFKVTAVGGLAFAQTNEWGYWHFGGRYEGKKWLMTGLSYCSIIDNKKNSNIGGLQLQFGWRF